MKDRRIFSMNMPPCVGTKMKGMAVAQPSKRELTVVREWTLEEFKPLGMAAMQEAHKHL